MKVWRVIKLGYLLIIASNKDRKILDDGQASIEKIPTLEDYTDEWIKITQINSNVKNILYNAISG